MFATEFEGPIIQEEFSFLALYLVLTFGFVGAPGEWMIFAWNCKLFHEAWRPEDARWSSPTPFHNLFLMDDAILVEPRLGHRALTSRVIAEEGIQTALGEGALNLKKDREEGAFEVTRTIWGLQYDTRELAVGLPLPKLEKAYLLLYDGSFDSGARRHRRKMIEQLRGNQQYWVTVKPALHVLLPATDALLAYVGAPGLFATPRGSEEQVERAYVRFEEAVELQRVMVADR